MVGMPQDDLFKFVQSVRKQALSPATLGASLNTESAKIKERLGRSTKVLMPEEQKKKALLDSI